jgi:Holliday junction resolvasome RuvABC ATP-dependent DNA helicase subunit
MSGMSRIIGQHEVVQSLRSFGSPFTKDGGTPGHILIVGQGGTGKRTIARAFAEEFGLSIVEIEAQTLKGEGDLAAVLTSLEDRSVLLTSNIQEIHEVCIDLLTEALENFRIRLETRQGAASQVSPLDLNRFTCIATVTRETDCSPKLQGTFSLAVQLQAYTRTELEQIVQSIAESIGFAIQPSVAKMIAGTGKGNPRRTQSMLVQLSKESTNFPATEEDARRAFGLPDKGKQYGQTIAAADFLQQLSGIAFEESITGMLQRMGFRTEMIKASGTVALISLRYSISRWLAGVISFNARNSSART